MPAMRRLHIGSVCLLALPLVAVGCVERLVDFHVRRVEGVRVTHIDGEGFNLVVRCRLENPNRLGAELRDVRFRSLVGQDRLGEGTLPGPITVAARSPFTLEAPVRVAFARLPADFPARVRGGFIRLRTEADLTAKTQLGTYHMHLVSEDRTRIAEALEVAIQGPFKSQAFRIDRITLGGVALRRVSLRVRFTARNLFPFPVRITRGSYTIAINGSHFGDGTLQQPISIPPRGQASAEVDLLATHGAVGSAIAAMMGQDPRFRLKGTLWIDPIGGVERLPIDIEADSTIFGRED